MSTQRTYEISRMGAKVNAKSDMDVMPGKGLGFDFTEQVQQYIKRQKKAKGQNKVMAAGDANELDIKLPGDARVMLGFVLNWTAIAAPNTVPSGNFSLIVNNEIVIDSVQVEFFGKDYIDEEYYFFPRPLSAKDEIKVQMKGVGYAWTLNTNFYYI